MDNKTFLSVVMPVFNGEKYLEESILSILNQTHHNFEFILVDDGSTDRSSSIIKTYEKKDGRIKYLRQKNSGIGETKNRGAKIANGKYIVFLDQDDIAYPDRFKQQIDYFRKNESVVCLGSGYDLIDPKSRKLVAIVPPTGHDNIYRKNMLEGSNVFCSCTVMVKTKAVIRAGSFNQYFSPADDYDLWLRLGRLGRVENLKAILAGYRIHSKNESYQNANLIEFKRWEVCILERRKRGIQGIPLSFQSFNNGQRHTNQGMGQLALHGGNWNLALEYGIKQIFRTPFKRIAWGLCFLAFLGLLGFSGQSVKRIYFLIRKISKRNDF